VTHAVGVVGLGNIGMPIARRLSEVGMSVRGYDTKAERVAELGDSGVEHPGELAGIPIVCVVTPDLEGVSDLLAPLIQVGGLTTIIVISTVAPFDVIAFAEEMAESDVSVVEAPVSGGAKAAEAGELTMFIGGDADDIHRTGPITRALASTTVRLGPVGSASAAKLANQLVLFASATALAEGLDLARRFGADPADVRRAVSLSLGDTWVGRNWDFFPGLVAEYERAGTPRSSRPWRKDLAEVVETAERAGVDLALAPHVERIAPARIETLSEIP
jgi:3-hydroxyisobutyrate dehydrogenase